MRSYYSFCKNGNVLYCVQLAIKVSFLSKLFVRVVMESLVKFETPSTCLVIGPSGAGKSSFVFEVLKNAKGVFKEAPKKIYICFGVYQKLYDDIKETIPDVEFYEGLPTIDMLETWAAEFPEHNKILLLDDLLSKGVKSVDVVDIFCQYSHHYQFTCWFICQNLFNGTKEFRTISLNTHYFILFKNQRDELQIQTLARQLGQASVVMSAYKQACSEKYGYLVIDLSPHSDPEYKLRTHIFPHQLMSIFLPEKKA